MVLLPWLALVVTPLSPLRRALPLPYVTFTTVLLVLLLSQSQEQGALRATGNLWTTPSLCDLRPEHRSQNKNYYYAEASGERQKTSAVHARARARCLRAAVLLLA